MYISCDEAKLPLISIFSVTISHLCDSFSTTETAEPAAAVYPVLNFFSWYTFSNLISNFSFNFVNRWANKNFLSTYCKYKYEDFVFANTVKKVNCLLQFSFTFLNCYSRLPEIFKICPRHYVFIHTCKKLNEVRLFVPNFRHLMRQYEKFIKYYPYVVHIVAHNNRMLISIICFFWCFISFFWFHLEPTMYSFKIKNSMFWLFFFFSFFFCLLPLINYLLSIKNYR